jgi:hypothetical protein
MKLETRNGRSPTFMPLAAATREKFPDVPRYAALRDDIAAAVSIDR